MKKFLLLILLWCQSTYGIDYIRTHHELIPAIGSDATRSTPDPTDANESFRIESGQTVQITGVESCKNIYVDGMGDQDAILELTAGCELRCQTILIAGPRAYLRTPAGCKIVWRNLPFDITTDPQQFGNGLIVISGKWESTGDIALRQSKQAVMDIDAGSVDIWLDPQEVHTNWAVGDELWIPDTRQPATGEQTEVRTIASVTQMRVTVTEPFQFNHFGWRNRQGFTGEHFEIANVTQPIILQSESATGRRGHAIFLDHARVDVAGVQFRDMGRTTVAPLHNTLWTVPGDASTVTQYGQNQIGRYAVHFHGCPGDGVGEWNQIMRHCSIVGSPKLGLVLHHSSHFGLFDDWAIVDVQGGAFVTETPNVYGNCFSNSIIIGKTRGSGLRITDRNHRNQAGGDHWHGGVGLALQSAMNEFENIDIYAMKEGIGLAGFGTSYQFRPTRRGIHTDMPGTQGVNLRTVPARYPFLPSSDVRVWGASGRGIETWTADCYPETEKMFPGLTLIHCPRSTDFEDQKETTLFDYRILGDWSQVVAPTSTARPSSYGLDWKGGYRFGITVNGGEVVGHGTAYNYVLDDDYTTFNGTHFDCPCIAYHSLGRYDRMIGPQATTWNDCTWGPSVRVLMDGQFPKYDLRLWMRPGRTDIKSLEPIVYEVSPWKDGRDYRLYHYEQLADFALNPIAADQAYGDWPVGVWTHQQLIDRGLAIFGAVVPSTAFQREDFGPFWADDLTLTNLVERVDDLEHRVDALEMP